MSEYFLYGEIMGAEDLAAYIAKTDSPVIHINSPGGNIFSAQAIYNLIKSKNTTILVEGLCASAATVLACGGRCIAAKNSLFMIHNPAVGLNDMYTAEELNQLQNSLESIKDSILQTYSTKMKLSTDEISKLMDAETWLNAEEALEIGLVDMIEGEVSGVYDRGRYFVNGIGMAVESHVAEKLRVSELVSAQSGNLAVDAIINAAVKSGASLKEIQVYIDAVKNLGSTPVEKVIKDNMSSGGEEVGVSALKVRASRAELIARFANELQGVVR